MSNERKNVPAAALCFNVGPIELGDNGESSRSAPFRMVARSGEAIDHWWWGRVVHDLSGMRLPARGRVAIDYVHDENQIIGYASKFDTDSGDLVAEGALTPYTATESSGDRATEIIHKARQGVPYEASINFGGDGITIDKYTDGEQVSVNGRDFTGPVTVIREWPLRGIAVCPYGADGNTSTTFSAKEYEVEIKLQETNLAETAEAEAVETTETEAVEESQSVDAVEDNDTVEGSPEPVEAAPAELAEPPAAFPGLEYLEEFGDQGGVWFAQGKSIDEARALFVESLKTQNEELRQQVSALRAAMAADEPEPIKFETGSEEKKSKNFIRLANE